MWHDFASFGVAFGSGARAPETDEEEYQDERKRELLLDDKVGAQRRDFRV
jgi:hypothetical protein